MKLPKLRRRICLLLLLIALLSVAVFRVHLAWLPNYQAARAMDALRFRDAHWWLDLGEFIAGENPRTELLRSRAHRKSGDAQQAEQHLTKASALGLASNRVQREQILIQAQAGQVHETLPALNYTLLADPLDMPEAYEAFVLGLIKARVNIRTAIDLCYSWAADFPDDPRPHLLLSKLAIEIMDTDVAAAELRRVLEVDPNHGPGALALAELMLTRQEVAEAVKLLQIAAKDESTRLPALTQHARCLRLLERTKAARTLLETVVLKEDPRSPLANVEWARLEILAGRHESAIARLNEVLSRAPNNHEARQVLARALRSVGRTNEAREQLGLASNAQKALVRAKHLVRKLPLDPRNVDLRYEIGCIYLTYGDAQVGVNWLRSVLYFDANHQGARKTLAEFDQRQQHTSDQ